MKKILLSLAAVACAATMSAASYTVFDIANGGTWTGGANGYSTTVTVGGKTFNLSTDKADSTTDLISPVANNYAWRVYKGSKFKIESSEVTMKSVVITYDDFESGKYIGTGVLSSGWTGSLNEAVYTCVSNGLKTFEMQSAEKQVRIKTIVVSDEEGGGSTPDDPQLPDGIIYQNAFDANLDGWVKINDESLSDFSGWKINTNTPKCAICNSYYGGSNHVANAKMEYTFNLKDYTDCKLEVEQAFGYDFPTSQVDNYRLYVKSGNNTDYLTFANFPAAPESGNWTKSFALNEFDLSEYDGLTITIGFEYATDGSKSRAWELKNFILSGNKSGSGVASVDFEENAAPVYYNLQGVRVANPENGIFIVVKGSKVSKVVR
ncbi:MAG: hypothetical protein K2G67_07820 [Muribaculaceae bacterium]|nr:hypothetical protein [Muribaculaceae bacterium]